MVTFWEIAPNSVNHMFSFVFWLFVILVISRFGFKGWIWVLIASVPDRCILLTVVVQELGLAMYLALYGLFFLKLR